MNKGESLDLLFFELASESRLDVLRELSASNLKMQEVARKLDLTATEASRQLQRMSKAKLIQRQPDGTYTVTQFGKLTLTLSTAMGFAFKNKQYFLEHSVWELPVSFVYRLGELSQGVLVTEMNEVMVRWEELIKAAEKHLLVMTPQIMPSLSQVSSERLAKGVTLRCINNEQLSETSRKYMQSGRNVERRVLPRVPAVILATQKEAAISFPLSNGKTDISAFFGNDTSFLKWADDLFFHCWDQGKRWYPGVDSTP